MLRGLSVQPNIRPDTAVASHDEARRVLHGEAQNREALSASELSYSEPRGFREEPAPPDVAEERPALLLHSCCGPCSTAVVERLNRRFRITIYFCNSNITEEDEYRRRLDAQRSFVDACNASADCTEPLTLAVAPYAPEAFLEAVRGLESEPEGGARCRICVRDRLERTAAYAAMHGFDTFSTTLSVSPHKNFVMISELGHELALRYGLAFLAEDFKKQDGFRRSAILSEAYGLYRQSYCGCRFSARDGE